LIKKIRYKASHATKAISVLHLALESI